jgi:hypothetical protein
MVRQGINELVKLLDRHGWLDLIQVRSRDSTTFENFAFLQKLTSETFRPSTPLELGVFHRDRRSLPRYPELRSRRLSELWHFSFDNHLISITADVEASEKARTLFRSHMVICNSTKNATPDRRKTEGLLWDFGSIVAHSEHHSLRGRTNRVRLSVPRIIRGVGMIWKDSKFLLIRFGTLNFYFQTNMRLRPITRESTFSMVY